MVIPALKIQKYISILETTLISLYDFVGLLEGKHLSVFLFLFSFFFFSFSNLMVDRDGKIITFERQKKKYQKKSLI